MSLEQETSITISDSHADGLSDLVTRLRSGDEAAFEELIAMHQSAMLRVAMIYVTDLQVAEEVVQDTWLGVLRGLDRFEARSSLKTWIFSILINRAKTKAQREGRYVALESSEEGDYEPSVDPERFFPNTHPDAGDWVTLPASWEGIPEDHFESQETLAHIQRAIDALPPTQREVITLRDIEHWSSQQVCNILGLTESNQRVLLHRARSKVRQYLENYLNIAAE
jgi:RNA polymerase sigma-70 factor (ECF subfamily)